MPNVNYTKEMNSNEEFFQLEIKSKKFHQRESFHQVYHLTNVFTNCSMNIDQLVFKLLEVTWVLVRKSLKFLLLRNQVPIVRQSTLQSYMFWYDKKHVYISTIFQIEILDRRMAPFTTF
jgi:hypothetical protein